VFKLTRQEMYVVAFLAGAILLGSAVRQWRDRQAAGKTDAMAGDTRRP
jgi:hypothetical protein